MHGYFDVYSVNSYELVGVNIRCMDVWMDLISVYMNIMMNGIIGGRLYSKWKMNEVDLV